MVVAAVMFVATFAAVGLVLAQLSTPDVLTNLPNQLPMLCGVAAVVLVISYAFETTPAAYGLSLGRQWLNDFAGGAVIGALFQAVSTAAILATGSGRIVSSWSMGVFSDPVTVGLAIGATAAAFVIVGLWEDFIFRGVLIRELVVGLTSRQVSRPAATGSAVVVSALVFGAIHLNAGAAGLSASVAVVQAVVGGLYFGLAYVLTDSLALPVGIHFSTNLWTSVVFGQPESGYPAAFRLTRPFDLGADLIVVLLLPTAVLIVAIMLWVRVTRGEVPEASLRPVGER
ncbi:MULTISPECIES: CPBP family intramembrane glutamic endopeptidase [unclassified Halorubrum]|uniref:CPBP family intramembrane glutamic endopeptidase n=1 Tax=unclassified Halorubrum TaxID=2642239 RepID=UPI0014832F9A|nr:MULTISPECIES: type II CAAX endopeptidase family protein [unclassified Halorubrum]